MANPTQVELQAIAAKFFKPRSYHQKQTLAKVFVMRWAIASGIDLNNPFEDTENIKWCKPWQDLSK